MTSLASAREIAAAALPIPCAAAGSAPVCGCLRKYAPVRL
jgi:hypothetical protein